MIVEYNKFNILLYFLVGVAATFGLNRFIYGGMVLLLSVFTLIQTLVLHSDNPIFIKYKNVTGLLPPMMIIIIIMTSLYVLMKSTIEDSQKMLSIMFLLITIGYSSYRHFFSNNPIFALQITNYIASLLFMVVIINIMIISDNQSILKHEYDQIRHKVKK